jgi:uncharacterized membrane protein
MDSAKRSLAKTISWRVTGSGATFLITFLVSGDLKIAGSVALIQITANTLLYFLHERVWNSITWGRKLPPS